MLICREICFVAIYAVLARNKFCPDLRAFVWKNLFRNCACGEKRTNIRYGRDLVTFVWAPASTRILNRLNQPDSEDADIENLKSEMETLVDKAEQIEANLENIEHMENQEVQIVVNDYDQEEEENEENSLDDEVRMITSDLGDRRGKGKQKEHPPLRCLLTF